MVDTRLFNTQEENDDAARLFLGAVRPRGEAREEAMLDLEAIKRRIEQTCEDAGEFIQHAPGDLDALVAEVERLRLELHKSQTAKIHLGIGPDVGGQRMAVVK